MSTEIKPGYKMTEIGVIPEEWDLVTAGQIGRFRGGNGFPLEFQGELTGTYPYFKVSDMNNVGNETMMHVANNYISEITRKALGAAIFAKNSIVFAKVGAAVFLERKRILAQPSCLDNNMSAFELDDKKANYRYVHHRLLNIRLSDLVSTTALPSLSGKVLSEIKFPLPPLEEQCAIATALSDVDVLLTEIDRLIAKKRDIQQATMQQLLTGQRRLPGFSGEWEVKRLGDLVARMANGCVYTPDEKNGVPITRIETISDGTINWDRIGYAQPSPEIEPYKIQCGDILYSHINSIDHIGKVARYSDCKPLYHGMNLILLRPTSNVDSNFLFFLLSSEAIRRTARTLAKQAVSQASINTKELRSLELTIPDVDEQTAIALILSDMDAELAALEARRDKARQLKQGMMQVLLTGRVRLA